MKFIVTYYSVEFGEKKDRRRKVKYVITDTSQYFKKFRDEMIYFSRCCNIEDMKINNIKFSEIKPCINMNPSHRRDFIIKTLSKKIKYE